MTPQTLIDDLAEILVVPSFTRLGFELRRRLFGWPAAESWSMAGRTVVLTGPTSGLGRETAGSLARMGARLVMVGRSADRLERTRAEVLAETPDAEIATVVADMASLASVRAAAAEILEREPRLDVIIDNAGTIVDMRQETDDGFELTFATMVLGPFALVGRLLPRLAESPDPRIVAVTSGGMYTQALPLDDLGYERGEYSGPRAYARAKRAQVALVREWARRLDGRGVAVNAMHPGWAATPGLAASLPGFYRLIGGWLRSAAQGVDTMLWLAAAPEARNRSGRLYLDRRERPFDRIPSTRLSAAQRRELWDRVVRLTDEPDPSARWLLRGRAWQPGERAGRRVPRSLAGDAEFARLEARQRRIPHRIQPGITPGITAVPSDGGARDQQQVRHLLPGGGDHRGEPPPGP